jgi:ribosome-associated heat shock protein Hsp15
MTEALRLDKWLWHARFVRRRQIAADLVVAGRVRVNGEVITKTHRLLRPGDIVTLVTPHDVKMVKVVDLGTRRGSSAQGCELYEQIEA